MKYLFLLLIMVSASAFGQSKKHSWKLIWQDEFSTDGAPDSAKWSFSGREKPAWQCYCTDNAATTTVKDGKLYLSGIVSNDPDDTATYQTGCIETKHTFSFQYGKIEVRAKVPGAHGSWPAIWLMPEKSVYGGWPKSGEIDIMEHLNHDSIYYQTVHSAYTYIEKHTQHPPHGSTAPMDPDAFNVFGLEWYPDRMDFFINGKKVFTYPKLENGPASQWPFDQAFYIILDQALGGWPGKIDDQALPATMQVDWVRVYKQRKRLRGR